MSKTLHLTVGLPYSGKSTWAREQEIPIVCPDEIRVALHGKRFVSEAEPFVWAIARVMVRALFRAGHSDVILDATNTTRERRDEWINTQWASVFHVMETPAAECMRRAEAAGDMEILPVIDRMAGRIEGVNASEGPLQMVPVNPVSPAQAEAEASP